MEVTYALFGDYRVGKTTFLIRQQTGKFVRDYTSTNGTSIRRIELETNVGNFTITVTEDHLNEDCEGIIVMFDITNYDTYQYSKEVITKFNKMCPNTPIVWVANKLDTSTRRVFRKEVEYKMEKLKVLDYVEISVANGYNIDLPITTLLQNKLGVESDTDDCGDSVSSITMSDNE